MDFVNFTTINSTFLLPAGENEIKLEAGAIRILTGVELGYACEGEFFPFAHALSMIQSV